MKASTLKCNSTYFNEKGDTPGSGSARRLFIRYWASGQLGLFNLIGKEGIVGLGEKDETLLEQSNTVLQVSLPLGGPHLHARGSGLRLLGLCLSDFSAIRLLNSLLL